MRNGSAVLVVLIFASVTFAAEKTKTKIRRVDSMIAVFDLDSRGKIDKDISLSLSDSIRLEILKGGQFELVDRGNMDKIFSEQKLQLSGCVSGQCVVEAGQLLGVGKIITGSINKLGNTFYLSLSLINAETGKIEKASEDECECRVDDLIKSSKRLVKRLMGESVPEPPTVTTSAKHVEEREKERLEREKVERERLEREKWEKERQEKLARGERFGFKDGIIEDFRLGLQWAPAPDRAMNHYEAEAYARNLSLGGGGWRLPTRAELKSLKDNLDPAFNVKDGWYAGDWVWTSELDGSSSAWSSRLGRSLERSYGRDYSHDTYRVLVVRSRR